MPDPLEVVVLGVGAIAASIAGLAALGRPRAAAATAGTVGALMGAAYLYLNTKRPAGPSGFGVRHTTEDVSVGVDLRGKVALVTGPTSGIGFETAFALALRGAHVVLAARNPKKLAETIAALERRLSLRGVSAHLTALQLDLSSLASVRAATDAFYGLGLSLDILVLNAGVMVLKRRQATADGFEMQVGSNHLGHFALATALLPALRAASPSRVVVLSSVGYRRAKPAAFLEQPQLETVPYDPWTAYGNSKLANALFARELTARYAAEGVTAYSVHPGGIRTGLQTDVEPWLAFKWALVSPFFAKTVPQGAATTVFCATAPLGVPGAPVPGAYHEDCNASKIAPAFDALLGDAAVTRRFWDASEALVRKALAVAPEAPAGSCGCPHEPMAIDA